MLAFSEEHCVSVWYYYDPQFTVRRRIHWNLVLLIAEQVNVRPVANGRILAQMDGGAGQGLRDLVFFSGNVPKGKLHAVGQYHGNVDQIHKLLQSRIWIVIRRLALFASSGKLMQKVMGISADAELRQSQTTSPLETFHESPKQHLVETAGVTVGKVKVALYQLAVTDSMPSIGVDMEAASQWSSGVILRKAAAHATNVEAAKAARRSESVPHFLKWQG